MHGANRDVAAGGFNMLVENLECYIRFFDSGTCTIQLCCRSDKHAKFVRKHTTLGPFCDPSADRLDLLAFILERANHWWRTVEHRDRIAPVLGVAVNVDHDRAEQTVRLPTNLVGS